MEGKELSWHHITLSPTAMKFSRRKTKSCYLWVLLSADAFLWFPVRASYCRKSETSVWQKQCLYCIQLFDHSASQRTIFFSFFCGFWLKWLHLCGSYVCLPGVSARFHRHFSGLFCFRRSYFYACLFIFSNLATEGFFCHNGVFSPPVDAAELLKPGLITQLICGR